MSGAGARSCGGSRRGLRGGHGAQNPYPLPGWGDEPLQAAYSGNPHGWRVDRADSVTARENFATATPAPQAEGG